MSNYIEYEDKIAFHPGFYLKDIVGIGYSAYREWFAEDSGIPAEVLDALIKGEQDITEDIALRLSKTLNTSKEMWINLQKRFDDALKEIEHLKKMR